MPEDKVPLTREAFDRLKTELDYLEGEGRTKLAEEIGRARAHGDISENAEYHAAKDQQGLQEARARQLRHMLENAEIIEASAEDGVIRPGTLVTIRHEGEEPETYVVGLREERPEDYPVLTPSSPLGQALLGHSAGETVTARVPAGEVSVEIVDVRPN